MRNGVAVALAFAPAFATPPAYAAAASVRAAPPAPQRVAYALPPGLPAGLTLALPAMLPPQPAAAPAVPPVAAKAPEPPSSAGHDLASAAYARVAAGDRRGAVALFDAALASDPAPGDAALRPLWTAERRRLVWRWSGDAYTPFRDSSPAGPAASPVLGGGQSGSTLAWTYDPLARRRAGAGRALQCRQPGGSIDPATG